MTGRIYVDTSNADVYVCEQNSYPQLYRVAQSRPKHPAEKVKY